MSRPRLAPAPPPTIAAASGPNHDVLAAAAIAAIAFLVYAGTLGHALVWDDLDLRALVARKLHEGGLGRLLASDFTLATDLGLGYYRPVVLTSLWLDGSIWAGRAIGFHLTNLLLHAGCTVLVLALCRALGAALLPAWLGALLFAVHPVHVESVAFVSGRTDLWAALFVLLSAWTWARVERGLTRRPDLERACSGIALMLAGLSKENGLVLPAVLLAWHALGIGRAGEAAPRQGARLRSWIIVWALAAGAVVLLRWGVAHVPFGDPSAGGAGFDPGRITAILATYVRLLLWPWPLNAYYTPDQVALDVTRVLALAAFLGLVGFLASASRRRAGLVALAWIVGFLIPALGIVPISGSTVAERFLYVPSVGLGLLVALPWSAAATRRTAGRRALAIAAIAAAAVMAFATVVRARVWKDHRTLFTELVRTSPRYAGAYSNLAVIRGREGDLAGAIELLERAVALDPAEPTAHLNLAVQIARQGDVARAVPSLETALRLRPNFPQALENLARAYLVTGRPAAADTTLRRLIAIDSTRAEPWNNLGVALRDQGRTAEALAAFTTSARLRDDYALAHANRGATLLALGRAAEAIAPLQRSVELDPANAPAWFDLGRALSIEGRADEAMRARERLSQLDVELLDSLDRDMRERRVRRR